MITEKEKEYCRRYRLKNKEKIREYRKLWNKTEAGKLYKKRWRYKIKITLSQHKDLINKQKNLCAICGKQEKNKALAIDHNHLTGKIRGLLCQKCNRGIGCFNDETFLVQNAYGYLKTNN